MYLICSVDVNQFDLYNRGDKQGIVVGGCHCTYIYIYIYIYIGFICFSFEYIINYIIYAECDLDISILGKKQRT